MLVHYYSSSPGEPFTPVAFVSTDSIVTSRALVETRLRGRECAFDAQSVSRKGRGLRAASERPSRAHSGALLATLITDIWGSASDRLDSLGRAAWRLNQIGARAAASLKEHKGSIVWARRPSGGKYSLVGAVSLGSIKPRKMHMY